VSALQDDIRKVAKDYPHSKSAILPALRMAQEQYGWLPPEALAEVGEALDLTPAYCMAVASFYDMLHLEPIGTHTIEVCTNICCGLVNAQAVLESFERELGLAPGETTADGAITLRAVECLGGCSTPTIVAVDGRYRQSVKPEDAAGIVEELRGA